MCVCACVCVCVCVCVHVCVCMSVNVCLCACSVYVCVYACIVHVHACVCARAQRLPVKYATFRKKDESNSTALSRTFVCVSPSQLLGLKEASHGGFQGRTGCAHAPIGLHAPTDQGQAKPFRFWMRLNANRSNYICNPEYNEPTQLAENLLCFALYFHASTGSHP